MKIQEIKAKIAELTEQAKILQIDIDNFELDPDDYTDRYDDMLDDCHGDFMGMTASRFMKEMDPTGYRCVFLDYLDGFDQDEEKRACQDYG